MPGDAASTRRRILDAATAEFAAYGIAGARVDRIAAASGANKAMIYKYFGSKDQLFDAVFDAIVVQTMDDVPITGDDLPGYAIRMWDWQRHRPELLRVAHWDRLERGGAGMTADVVRKATADKTEAIADAQRRGLVDDTLPPATLLTLILELTRTGLDSPDPATHRTAIETAVGRLTTPPRTERKS
ncbi:MULTISPECIES: TetR/AcrR family transcriptional regulator [Catenuloplanes]|uniref:AcrR family transcriptional regulator n=1 Tax=Catenuloplanes niger TaxID=587534 RepID=A0AAE4CPG4_9ACTN|nr:TetR family transcriptional regulator [Catenuloplanes niger]MDR7319900.1 AcrR family transcriptional regulator [Catenuloplanes niger]